MQDGFTPLTVASYFGHKDVVARLLKANATPDIQGEVKSSTLRWDGWNIQSKIVTTQEKFLLFV